MGFRKIAVLFLLPALLLAGCAQTLPAEELGFGGLVDSSEEPSSGAELSLPETFSLPYHPDAALDPVTCPDGIQQTLGLLLYEGLFELDERLEPQNKLCAAASYDAAALTWTLQLREDVVFSDGSPLTAADAADTLQRARTSRRYQARLDCIQSVSAAGNTLTVVLNRANGALPALLDIPIVKSGTASGAVPLGTGPYVFSREESCLTANAAWWGGRQPVDRIALVPCASNDAARYQFTSHAVQLLTADLTGTAPLSAAGNFSFQDADTTVLQYVGFNLNHSLLADPAVRRTLGLGLDRASIVSAYLSGHAAAAQFPVSPVSSLYPADLETPYSRTAFEAAAAAAGLDSGKTHTLSLLVNSDNSFKVSVANYIASSLSVLDLHVTVKALPWEEYLAALTAGDYDLYYGETRLTADWDLAPLVGTGGSLNLSGYSDPVLDQLLSNCAAAQDRTGAMRAVCAHLSRQAPILPVCFKRSSVLIQADVVENLTPTASNPFYNLTGCVIHLSDKAP